jgi:putative transposase
MKGHVAKDHVYLFLSIPLQVTISRLLQWLKGKTAHHLLAEFAHLKK